MNHCIIIPFLQHGMYIVGVFERNLVSSPFQTLSIVLKKMKGVTAVVMTSPVALVRCEEP